MPSPRQLRQQYIHPGVYRLYRKTPHYPGYYLVYRINKTSPTADVHFIRLFPDAKPLRCQPRSYHQFSGLVPGQLQSQFRYQRASWWRLVWVAVNWRRMRRANVSNWKFLNQESQRVL